VESTHVIEAAVIHIAATLSIAAEWKSDTDEPVPELEAGAYEAVGITEDDIDPMLVEADQQVVEAAQILLPQRR
jgi:hypothetical protein